MHTSATSKGRVVIVEDSLDLKESIVKYLRNKGIEAVGVGSAMEFYHEVATGRYSLAIVDLALPDQDGIVLSQYLRSNTSMRIIILTSRSSAEDRISGYDAGADIYMVKPVDFRELLASVTNLLCRVDELAQPHGDAESAEANEGWRLDKRNWALVTPDGVRFRLTSKEYLFIECIASEKLSIVQRRTVLTTLGYEHSEYGNRALESLVYRLRKKLSPMLDLPIKTVSGTGYSLTSPLYLV